MKKELLCPLLISGALFFRAPASLPAQESQAVAFVEQLQARLEQSDLDGAIALYDDIPAPLENDTGLQVLYASLLLSAGRTADASAVGRRLLAADGDDTDVLELNANIAAAAGDKQTQQTVIDRLLAADPCNATANIILGNQQALKKKYKLASGYYKKALDGEPENTDALLGFARMAYYLGDLKTSEEKFRRLLELDGENAEAFAYLGKLAAEEENYLRATNYIQKAIALDGSNYDFYIDLGQYMRSRGKLDEAEKAWKQAVRLDPDYFLAYTYLAGLYDEQNRLDEALDGYHKIIETNPKYYFAYEETGILEFHRGNWSAARKAFLKADSVSSSISYRLMILATYLKQNNPVEAKKYAQTVMKPLGRDTLDYQMVRLYHDQGGVNAENAVAKAIEKETDKNKRGKMMYYMGLYYELKGLPQIAEEYYNRVAAIQVPMFFEYRLAEWGLAK